MSDPRPEKRVTPTPLDHTPTVPSTAATLTAEAFGTFLLVLGVISTALFAAGFGEGTESANKGVGFLGVSLAVGLTVVAGAYAFGPISGGHFNPAVTLGLAAAGRFSWRKSIGYIIAQIIGGILAALFLNWAYGGILNGATEPGQGISDGTAALTEAILTLGLVSVILGTAAGARNVGFNGALAVGAYIGLVSVWGAPVSGASMNPGRSFAPMLVGGNLDHYWVYLVGPIVGALIAVGFEYILRGRPTTAGAEAAQGILDESPSGL